MDRVSEILYLYEDDVESFADGGTPQSVQPSVDGSRPGYRGLPVFVQKNTRSKKNPYRVRVKANKKLGRDKFEGKFSTLKAAKAKAAEFSDVVKETRNKRYTTLKELVIEANKGSELIYMKDLAKKVGIPSRDQNFARQLKNFNIPKLDGVPDKIQKEFFKIIKNPSLPIEEAFSLVTKISNKTGIGGSKVSHHLLKLPEYKESDKMLKTLAQAEFQKKIKGKGFTLGDFQEIVEQKKNVPKLQVSNISTPEKFIIDSAMRHNQQGGDKIKFFKKPGDIDKKGNLITHKDAEFGYKGKRHSYFSLLKDGRKLDDFKEVYKVADEMNDLLGREVVHPKTKEKVLFKDLMKESYNKGAGYTYTRTPYDIDHFKSVKDEPFKNLRVIPRRINTSEGILSNLAESAQKGFLSQAADLYSPEKVKAYRKKMGYEFTKDINKLFDDELKLADDILKKGRVLRTPLDIGKEKFLEQNLNPKHQQLIKNQFCKNAKGGTPGSCPIDEAMDNMIKQTNDVKRGVVKGAEATRIANKASKVVRFGTGKGLGAVLGPLGLAAEAVFEVAFAVPGYARGETGKRLLGDSLLGLIPGVGQSAEEEFDEYATKSGMSELEQQKIKDVNRFLELNNALPSSYENIGKGGRGDPLKGSKNFARLYDEYIPLYNQFVGGPPSESASTALAEQDRINQQIAEDKAERAEKRNIAGEEDFYAAGGGIAGIRRPGAIPPESGPQPQGLENLKYYVTNT